MKQYLLEVPLQVKDILGKLPRHCDRKTLLGRNHKSKVTSNMCKRNQRPHLEHKDLLLSVEMVFMEVMVVMEDKDDLGGILPLAVRAIMEVIAMVVIAIAV